MPILEQGYEPYRGTVRVRNLRAFHIALAALKRHNRWWVWILLAMSLLFGSGKECFLVFVVYVPAAVFGADPENIPNFFRALTEHPRFYSDMMAVQSFWAIVLGITVGAGEIAEDLRTGGLVFYLGRPVTRRDYVFGKTLAVSAAVVAVTLVPVVLLFTVQALFEGDWRWIADHLRALPAAAAYTAVLCVFVSGVVLGISAVARRRLRATVAIAGTLLALTAVGNILAPTRSTHSEERDLEEVMRNAKTREERREAWKRYSDAHDDLGSRSDTAGFRMISPFSSLSASARDVFGNELPGNFSGGRHWLLVLGAPLLLYGVLLRKVRAVEVVT